MTLNPEEFTNLNPNEAMEDDEDEDMCWEPLDGPMSASIEGVDTTSAVAAQSNTVSFLSRGRRVNHTNTTENDTSTTSSQILSDTMQPNNPHVLKQKLVDHPIQLFWSHFFMHLVQQLWEWDFQIRLGLSLVLVGIVLKLVVLFLSFSWYHPKTIVLSTMFTISFCYLDPLDVAPSVQRFGRAWSPDALVEGLERLHPAKLRYVCLSLMIFPTLLEARTVAYLALIQTEAKWLLYNVIIFLVIVGLLSYLIRVRQTSARDAWQKGVLVLYGSAILITIIRWEVTRLPLLAAPFCLATGTLLLTYRDNDMEWLSRTVRQALRLTLRDVLSAVSANVQQDEMLRIIMLRWIVDYWTGTATATDPSTPNPGASQATATRANLALVQRPNGGNQLVSRRELQWDELWSMLNVTTDQVQTEVPPSPYRHTSSSSSSFPTSGSRLHQNDSVDNVKAMLASMDLDQHAKPAVLAYKRAVEGFPPTRNVAIFLSLVRRCPAFLAWFWFYSAAIRFPWTMTLVLSPFVAMDFLRLNEWMASCQKAASQLGVVAAADAVESSSDDIGNKNFLGELDPMTILLSGDHFTADRPPTLLLVWSNVVSSVSALEMGLTAARCIQTTAVAAAFAQNMLSLAEFGAQVSEHGWFYGWSLLLQEWFQSADDSGRSATTSPKYTTAAINAVHHGNMVARNLRVLAEEGDNNLTFGHLWQFVTTFLGQGWSGQAQADGRADPRTASTVEISEVNDDDDDAAPTTRSQGVENSSIEAEPANYNQTTMASCEALSSVEPLSRVVGSGSLDHQERTKDISTVVELISICFERGLIDEDEKIKFESALVSGRGDDQQVREASDRKLETTLRSLIRRSSESPSTNDMSATEEADSALGRNTPDSFMGRDTPDLLTGADTADLILGRATPDSLIGRHTPDSTNELDSDRIDTSGAGLADSFVSSLLSRSQSFDEINSVQSIETSERARDFSQTPQANPESGASEIPPQQLQGEGGAQQGGDDWMKWMGGGLAIVGAVVGSVAIANAVQAGGGPPQPAQLEEQRRETASSVQTELLDEEESHGADEWVSVSRT